MAGLLVDLVNQCQVSTGIVPVVQAVTTQGTVLDFSNAEVSLNAVVKSGAYGANNSTFAVQIEECATTNGTFVVIPALAGGNMVTTVTTSNQCLVLAGKRTQQYVRANCVTVAGTTASVAIDVTIISQKKLSGVTSGVSRAPST